eukprot:PhM_4_TR5147/c0_g1_i3/m.75483
MKLVLDENVPAGIRSACHQLFTTNQHEVEERRTSAACSFGWDGLRTRGIVLPPDVALNLIASSTLHEYLVAALKPNFGNIFLILPGMKAALEGKVSTPYGVLTRRAAMEELQLISVELPVYVVPCQDEADVPHTLLSLTGYMHRSVSKQYTHYAPANRKGSAYWLMATEIPNVGEKRAAALVKAYTLPRLLQLIATEPKEAVIGLLAKVPTDEGKGDGARKIGVEVARNIYNAFAKTF